MNKLEFERLEQQAEKEIESAVTKKILENIQVEFIYIYNELIDFCYKNDLEPDAVIQIITSKLSKNRRAQIKKQGYISKI